MAKIRGAKKAAKKSGTIQEAIAVVTRAEMEGIARKISAIVDAPKWARVRAKAPKLMLSVNEAALEVGATRAAVQRVLRIPTAVLWQYGPHGRILIPRSEVQHLARWLRPVYEPPTLKGLPLLANPTRPCLGPVPRRFRASKKADSHA